MMPKSAPSRGLGQGLRVCLLSLPCAAASTTGAFGYDVILAIVIIEVIFAFSIGVVCILLSFNLFRALKDSPNGAVGEFPLSRGNSYNDLDADYSTFAKDNGGGGVGGSVISDEEMDFEGVHEGGQESSLVGIARSVFAYIRIW
mmetsp:Transcript_18415/g.40963  ORF Transcript_18415/g.40963 Transcript_18415/m.40963 type:complete len:144 (-) Transcript_18415:26-457(-)